MRIKYTPVTCITITGAERLDTINVILQEVDCHEGKIIVECYGLAWSAYFVYGADGFVKFLAGLDAHYLSGKLTPGDRRYTARQSQYLTRITEAIINVMRQERDAQSQKESDNDEEGEGKDDSENEESSSKDRDA